jgi:hypothetical protein
VGSVIITRHGMDAFQLYTLAIYSLLNRSTKSYFQCENESTPNCDYDAFLLSLGITAVPNSVNEFSVQQHL